MCSLDDTTSIDRICNYCNDTDGDVNMNESGAGASLAAVRDLVMGSDCRCAVDQGLAVV